MHAAGTNLNRIDVTADGRWLLAVQSNTGILYRVNPATGHATRVDLGGVVLTAGDGILVQGRTLYVVQNRLNRVAVFQLDPRTWTSGVETGRADVAQLRPADHRRRPRLAPLPGECPFQHAGHPDHDVHDGRHPYRMIREWMEITEGRQRLLQSAGWLLPCGRRTR